MMYRPQWDMPPTPRDCPPHEASTRPSHEGGMSHWACPRKRGIFFATRRVTRISRWPYLNWGGGQFDPPCTKSVTAAQPPQIATRLIMSFFFQVLRIFWYQVCENRTIGREVTWRLVLACRHKIRPKSAFCIYVCVQNTWKLLIFLKCSKTVFILSFWPFAQFLISWN